MASSMRLVNGHPCPAHLGPNGYGYATPSLLSLKNLLLCSNTPVDDYRRPCAVTPEEEFLLPMLIDDDDNDDDDDDEYRYFLRNSKSISNSNSNNNNVFSNVRHRAGYRLHVLRRPSALLLLLLAKNRRRLHSVQSIQGRKTGRTLAALRARKSDDPEHL